MKKFLAALFVFISILPPAFSAPPEVSELIRKVEQRRGSWIDLTADLKMNFKTREGRQASCFAKLKYNRLDEKILLEGFNDKNEVLFVFKTDDRDFQLYLPKAESVFSGSIFDLEDSPDIHSHLKALDLYRALKPAALPEERTTADALTNGFRLRVSRENSGQTERELFTNEKGDSVKEVYYLKSGKPKAVIQRADFEEIKKSKRESFGFPKWIVIQADGAGTELVFQGAHFASASDEGEFDYAFPEKAKRIDISETFKKQRALASSEAR